MTVMQHQMMISGRYGTVRSLPDPWTQPGARFLKGTVTGGTAAALVWSGLFLAQQSLEPAAQVVIWMLFATWLAYWASKDSHSF